MARLSILEKTIKILFGRSGNQCAFPGCEQVLIDGNNVIADVCHIEAANEDGERYNPEQTDEERRGEENLILLCATHHRVTNDVNRFTVEILKKMKITHESKFSSRPFDLDDLIANKIARFYNSQQNTNNISGQNENITINQIQNNGLAKIEDITALVFALFDANSQRISNVASQIAKSHVQRFASHLSEALKKENIDISEIEGAFTDLDMQIVFNNAVQSVGRRGTEELITMLSKLIILRIKSWRDENKKLLLNDAILTVHKLSKTQLDMLTANFLMHDYINYLPIAEWNDLNAYFNRARIFLDLSPTEIDFRHIQQSGCANFSDGARPSYSQILKNIFPTLFQKNGFQKTVTLHQETVDNLVCNNLDLGNLLIQLTLQSKLWALGLSSIGIIIAAANFEIVTQNTLNLECYFSA